MAQTQNKFLRIFALAAAIAVVLGFLYGGKVIAAFQHDHGQQQAASGERKVLYWYDAMNPQHHYDKPGKAPDGMDLVPMYTDQATPPAQSAAATTPKGERKILYWYDAMNPQHHYDKPGKAPDGMDLVPNYAEEQSTTMAPGSVMISAEKQQLIGVRTAEVKRETLVRDVRTTGQVTADETKIAKVHVKISGFIEKVFVDYIGP